MDRHKQVIQLSDHVKNKLKHNRYPSISSPSINSSDEFIEVNEDNNSLNFTSLENTTRTRRDTFTTYKVKQPSESFFTDRKLNKNSNNSILEEKYVSQQQQQCCQECIHRNRIIHYERQRLLRCYNENKNLSEQLRSSILLNQQYKDDIQKLKNHLSKINSHLYEYQINFSHLKEKILSEKKTNSKIDDNQQQKQEEEDTTIDHLKRLRYEIQMYNRIVASKQQQEEKQIDFLF